MTTKVKVEIKSRWNASVLFTAEVDASISEGLRLKAALEIAVKARANLAGADLARADLADAKGISLPTPEEAERRIKAVANAALASEAALDMGDWHTCETTHCIAGWAIHNEGSVGYILEKAVGSPMAGLMLLGVEAHAHFYDTTGKARKWLKSKLEPATQST